MENSYYFVFDFVSSFENKKAKNQCLKSLIAFEWLVLIEKKRSGDEVWFMPISWKQKNIEAYSYYQKKYKRSKNKKIYYVKTPELLSPTNQ